MMLKKCIPLFSLVFFFACSDNGDSSGASEGKVTCSVRLDNVTFTCLEMNDADAVDYLTEESCGEYATFGMNTILGNNCPSGADAKCEVSREGKNGVLYFYFEQDCAGVNTNEYMPKPVAISSSSGDVAGNLSSSSSELGSSSSGMMSGVFLDERDGQKYEYVTIGTQIWMAENLNYTISAGAWCYENDPANCTKYGRLYSWVIAMDLEGNSCDVAICTSFVKANHRGICPAGWHIPTDEEWETLADFAGNSLGEDFKVLLGGYYGKIDFLSDATFNDVETDAFWWSATGLSYAGNSAWNWSVGEADLHYNNKTNGYSVRCVKN